MRPALFLIFGLTIFSTVNAGGIPCALCSPLVLAKNSAPATASTVAINFLSLMYNVPKEKISITENSVTNETVSFLASFPGQNCKLDLLARPGHNKEGWVVQTHECKKQ